MTSGIPSREVQIAGALFHLLTLQPVHLQPFERVSLSGCTTYTVFELISAFLPIWCGWNDMSLNYRTHSSPCRAFWPVTGAGCHLALSAGFGWSS